MQALFVSLLVSVAWSIGRPPAGYPFYQASGPAPLEDFGAPIAYSTRDGIDAIFQRRDGLIYIFQDSKVWAVPDESFAPGVGPKNYIPTAWNIEDKFTDSITGVDAVYQSANGKVYIFVEDYYYRFTDRLTEWIPVDEFTLDTGYPKKISKGFIGLPSDLDGVISLPNGFLYFFKGDQYYRVRDKLFDPYRDEHPTLLSRVDTCFPAEISDDFLGVTTPITAVFRRNSDKRIYFFTSTHYVTNFDKYLATRYLDRFDAPETIKAIPQCITYTPVSFANRVPTTGVVALVRKSNGKIYIFDSSRDLYWRLTDSTFAGDLGDCLDAGYPKHISVNFPGMDPNPITAAYHDDNGKIYFFSSNMYYRFSDKYLNPEQDPVDPDVMDEGYPLSVTEFGLPVLPAGSRVVGAFQRINSKIYLFVRDASGLVSYYRITDKYALTDQANFVADPGYPLPLATSWEGIPATFDTVYQRVKSDQQIYFYDGGLCYRGIDKYLHEPAVCTACNDIPPQS